MPTKIESLTQLKKIASKEPVEFYIRLGESSIRSSKTIQYFPNGITPDDRKDVLLCRWDIFNHISDGYEEFVDDRELAICTNILEAIKIGAFYRYD
jgi:hypothetical protein